MAYEFNQEIPLKRVALMFKNGDSVNLGIGMPTQIPNYISKGVTVVLQSENGFIGMGPVPAVPDPDLQTAGGMPSSVLPGGAFFDSFTSFTMIRGGHIDYTVLGFLEVDQEANIANYKIPGKRFPGMGGAMDLVAGAKTVIMIGSHMEKTGAQKIRKKCTLPLTGEHAVNHIVTDAALFTFEGGKLTLKEVFEPFTVDWVKENTEASFVVDPACKTVKI